MKIRPTTRLIAGRVHYDYGDRLLPRVAGADDDTPPDLSALPEALRGAVAGVAELDDDGVGGLEADLLAHLDELPDGSDPAVEVTDEHIADGEATLAALALVRADAGRRFDEAAAADAEAQERRDRLAAIRSEAEVEEEAEPEGEGTETPPAPEGEQEPEGEGETPPAEETPPAPEGEQETEQARAAGARPYPSPNHRPPLERVAARRAPGTGRGRAPADHLPSTMTAAADVAGFAAGQAIPDMEALADAIVSRADAIHGVTAGADGMKYFVARLRSEYPEDRRVSRDNAQLSNQRMDAATGPQARVATGGLCAPLTPDYSQIGLSDASRPAWESIPHFGADRGGVRWVPPPRFSRGVAGGNVYDDGIGTWTVANDVTPADPATKPFARVDCATEQTEVIEATTKRLRIGNFYAMTFRERVQAIMDILDAEFAAVTEKKILDKMAVLATADVVTAKGFGAARDLFSKLDLLTAGFENRWRMAENHTPLRLFLPDWVHDLVRADLVRAMNTGRTLDEQLAVADAQIDSWVRARNVTPTWLMDGETGGNQTFGPQADGAIDAWPNGGDPIGYLFHDGALRIIDAGTLDIGLYRDSALNNTNDAELFMEEFWNVIFQGWELERVTFSLCPDGTSAGTSNYDPCTVGS